MTQSSNSTPNPNPSAAPEPKQAPKSNATDPRAREAVAAWLGQQAAGRAHAFLVALVGDSVDMSEKGLFAPRVIETFRCEPSMREVATRVLADDIIESASGELHEARPHGSFLVRHADVATTANFCTFGLRILPGGDPSADELDEDDDGVVPPSPSSRRGILVDEDDDFAPTATEAALEAIELEERGRRLTKSDVLRFLFKRLKNDQRVERAKAEASSKQWDAFTAGLTAVAGLVARKAPTQPASSVSDVPDSAYLKLELAVAQFIQSLTPDQAASATLEQASLLSEMLAALPPDLAAAVYGARTGWARHAGGASNGREPIVTPVSEAASSANGAPATPAAGSAPETAAASPRLY